LPGQGCQDRENKGRGKRKEKGNGIGKYERGTQRGGEAVWGKKKRRKGEKERRIWKLKKVGGKEKEEGKWGEEGKRKGVRGGEGEGGNLKGKG
jgi:hypothetical protein